MDENWPLWEDKGKWPFTPTDYVFLADAGHRLGRVFYRFQ